MGTDEAESIIVRTTSSSSEVESSFGKLLIGPWVVRIKLLHGSEQTTLLLKKMLRLIGRGRRWWGNRLLLWRLGSTGLLDSGLSSRALALAASLSGLLILLWLGRNSMDSGHMITQVPVAWKSISWDGSLTSIELAVKWLLSVSVHGMGLALVSEETGS